MIWHMHWLFSVIFLKLKNCNNEMGLNFDTTWKKKIQVHVWIFIISVSSCNNQHKCYLLVPKLLLKLPKISRDSFSINDILMTSSRQWCQLASSNETWPNVVMKQDFSTECLWKHLQFNKGHEVKLWLKLPECAPWQEYCFIVFFVSEDIWIFLIFHRQPKICSRQEGQTLVLHRYFM